MFDAVLAKRKKSLTQKFCHILVPTDSSFNPIYIITTFLHETPRKGLSIEEIREARAGLTHCGTIWNDVRPFSEKRCTAAPTLEPAKRKILLEFGSFLRKSLGRVYSHDEKEEFQNQHWILNWMCTPQSDILESVYKDL